MTAGRHPARRFAPDRRTISRMIDIVGGHKIVVVMIMGILIFLSPRVAMFMRGVRSLVHGPPQAS